MILQRIKDLNLRNKIMAMLGIVILIVIILNSFVFAKIYNRNEERIFGRESLNTLHSLNDSLSSIVSSADYYSKMLIADDVIRQQMATGDLNQDIAGQRNVINRIYSILQFSEAPNTVWLIDRQGQKLSVGGTSRVSAGDDIIRYEDLMKPYGRAEVLVDTNREDSCITLVRAYNSTADFSNLGIVGVDISDERVNKAIHAAVDVNKDSLLILDGENNPIFWSGEDEDWEKYYDSLGWDSRSEESFLERMRIDGKIYYVSGITDPEKSWVLIKYSPVESLHQEGGIFEANIVIIFIIGLMIFFCASIVAGMLTSPIQLMLTSMKAEEGCTPQKIDEKPLLVEFQTLFAGYNRMIDRINQLIEETIERQKRIRQVELNEIQEQMKPHFLYNTLDSIEALAMIGDTATVCRLIEALGGFYRKSVSGGREFLSVAMEMEMAKDYSEIMHIRFGDTFVCSIDYTEACSEFLIPKLTVQPLVENAFQHGIRGRVEFGNIDVSADVKDGRLCIFVNDNGTGIPSDVIEGLLEDRDVGGKGSLGLRGTIRRLKLVYGSAFSYEIGTDGAASIHLYIEETALKREEKTE